LQEEERDDAVVRREEEEEEVTGLSDSSSIGAAADSLERRG
jgi:hypothetical protein